LSCAVSPYALANLANGDYKWHVQTYSPAGYGAWTDFTNFTLNIPIVVLGSPSGTVTSWNGRFSWTGISGATYYHLQVFDASTDTIIHDQWFNTGICSGLNCAVAPAVLLNLANGDYQWHVQTYSPAGYGSWTDFTTFTLSVPTVVLVSPTGMLTSWNNQFSWTGISGATYYHLQVFDATTDTIIHDQWFNTTVCSGLDCAVSPSALLNLPSGNYKWKVRTYGVTGFTTWTTFMNFTIP
jgi:hypothetical protein